MRYGIQQIKNRIEIKWIRLRLHIHTIIITSYIAYNQSINTHLLVPCDLVLEAPLELGRLSFEAIELLHFTFCFVVAIAAAAAFALDAGVAVGITVAAGCSACACAFACASAFARTPLTAAAYWSWRNPNLSTSLEGRRRKSRNNGCGCSGCAVPERTK